MISVSEAWKSLHGQTILPESHVELTYWITEPGAQDLAEESNTGATFFSNHEAIVSTADVAHPKYATLENNLWALDGSFDIIPDSAPYGDTGYVADADYPMVTISFPSVRKQPIPGITIVWSETYGEYPTRVRIAALNGTEIVYEYEFYNDSVRSTFDMPVVNYDRFYIEIIDWINPDHRPRIEKFYLGAIEVYTESALVSYSHTQSADLLSTVLPKNEIKFSLDNSSDIWNPDNPGANVRYLMDRQEISVRYGYKLPTGMEWIKAGTFWLNSWDTPANGLEATFTARDLLEFMDSIYTGPTEGTLYDVASAALIQADLPTKANGEPRYYLDQSLRDILTKIEEGAGTYTIAEIVQMCANAGLCVMRIDRDGVLRIEKLQLVKSDYEINQKISYTHPERSMTKPAKEININESLATKVVASSGEQITLRNPLVIDLAQASSMAEWLTSILMKRNIVKGSFRPDPRLDALDIISIESKYSNNFVGAVTDITYTYNGAFKGEYTCREVEV